MTTPKTKRKPPISKPKSGLSDRQKLFCVEYLIDLNASDAARRAGYSERTAGQMGHRLLQYPGIKAEIARHQQNRVDKLKIDAEYVLKRLVEIDEMDVLDILDPSGAMKPVDQWPKIWRQMISGLDVVHMTGSAILKKIKWPDKVKNLELLGRHVTVQAFKDKLEVDGELKNAVPVINLNLTDGRH